MEAPGQRGKEAEQLAESWLRNRGLLPVCRNFRCRSGEIDLIMRDGESLVFVEVRFRKNHRFGTPAETVCLSKQQRLIKAAYSYLQRRKEIPQCRFDVISVTGEQEKSIEWIPNAFDAAL